MRGRHGKSPEVITRIVELDAHGPPRSEKELLCWTHKVNLTCESFSDISSRDQDDILISTYLYITGVYSCNNRLIISRVRNKDLDNCMTAVTGCSEPNGRTKDRDQWCWQPKLYIREYKVLQHRQKDSLLIFYCGKPLTSS